MRKIFLLLTTCFFISITNAQWVNGKIIGESGMAARSVNVNFKNKTDKVLSNADGTFKIKASNIGDTLVFNSPGYEPYEVVISEKNIKDPAFEVVLLNKRSFLKSSPDLAEVVVTSGGGIKRERKELGSTSLRLRGMASASEVWASEKDMKFLGSGVIKDGRKLMQLDTTGLAVRAASSRILTAGEVNDFMKWKMWEDISAAEFAAYSKQWGMNAKNRYSVQLQDQFHNAIINEPVHLIKSNGDTVWTAITDNTGKAELWAGLWGSEAGVVSYSLSTKDGNTKMPAEFQNGINFLTVQKSCEAPPAVDISFVVDATGSMGDEIEFLKLELEEVLKKIPASYPDLDMRYSSVFYRDRGDEYVTKKIDFQSEMLKVLNFVKLQSAGGGGDMPEALDSALDVAITQLQWRPEATARLLFLFLDAPAHEYAKQKMQVLIQVAAAKGIRIIPIACSGTDKSTEFLLRTIALATNGTYTFLTDDSKVGGGHIKPTTDNYKVELLNDLLQRVLQQCIYAKKCYNKVESPKINIIDPKQPDVVKLTLYPNPTGGILNIRSSEELKEVFITDFTGKILMKVATQKEKQWSINISQYPSATYLVKYVTKDSVVGYKQVVLIH